MIDALDLLAYAGGLFFVRLACWLATYMLAPHAARLDPSVMLRAD